jgi:DNA polymerase (family X)
MIDNASIAAYFRQLADLMELHHENPFKIKSYANAGRQLKGIELPLSDLSLSELEALPGVGKAIAEKIHTLVNTGEFPLLNKYLEITPPGVVELLSIKGLGPKKIARLWQELQIESPGELYYACLENRLTLLSGFGEKTQENILQAVSYLLENTGRQLFARAEKKWLIQAPYLQELLGPEIELLPTGGFARKDITLKEIELVVSGINLTDLTARLHQERLKLKVLKDRIIVEEKGYLPLNLIVVQNNQQEKTVFEHSCTPEHLAFVRNRITDDYEQLDSEAAIYTAAGLPIYPPEWRHEHPEWFIPAENLLNGLIDESHIKGVVHSHTTASDGSASMETLAHYCQEQGYQYLVVTDHSQAASYAGGLSPERVLDQQAAIDRYNDVHGVTFRVFKGIEADILNDGSLDYDYELLKTFDVVIASIHSVLNMDADRATQRLIKAIENPYTHILGHMTGRLLLARRGYQPDHAKIIDACAANGVSIELNANPHRLDIDWTWIPYCMEKGVMISINPDAHSLSGVKDIRYGVWAARKGALQVENCLNAYTSDDFIRTIRNLKA